MRLPVGAVIAAAKRAPVGTSRRLATIRAQCPDQTAAINVNNRGRYLRPPRPDHPVADLSHQRIKRRPVLGGLIEEYERAA